MRRCISYEIRTASGKFDFLLLAVAGMPFVTGYFLMKDLSTSVAMIDENLNFLHVLSAETLILVSSLLLCKTRIDPAKCIACMACAVNCPTEALSYHDTAATRTILYRINHCISCGTCVAICDDNAAELRHQVKLPTLRLNRKSEISRANLEACERCGVFFISEKHLSKIRKQNSDSYMLMCPECKQMVHVEHQYKLFFE